MDASRVAAGMFWKSIFAQFHNKALKTTGDLQQFCAYSINDDVKMNMQSMWELADKSTQCIYLRADGIGEKIQFALEMSTPI